MSMACLMVNATNGWSKDEIHQFTLSSCLLYNTSQLDYYCTDHEQDNTVVVNDHNLNTLQVTENLCGSYSNHQLQGSYVAIYTVTSWLVCVCIYYVFLKLTSSNFIMLLPYHMTTFSYSYKKYVAS